MICAGEREPNPVRPARGRCIPELPMSRTIHNGCGMDATVQARIFVGALAFGKK